MAAYICEPLSTTYRPRTHVYGPLSTTYRPRGACSGRFGKHPRSGRATPKPLPRRPVQESGVWCRASSCTIVSSQARRRVHADAIHPTPAHMVHPHTHTHTHTVCSSHTSNPYTELHRSRHACHTERTKHCQRFWQAHQTSDKAAPEMVCKKSSNVVTIRLESQSALEGNT